MSSELHHLRTLHLFSGAGGGLLADVLLGHQPVCAVEINDYCQQVLSARQADGHLPWFPIFDDVTTFDGKPWRGHVDVISGGFPCQDISVAGRGDGLDGERSGLWSEMARIIGEVQPRFAFVENSPMLTSRGLDKVLGDLSEMGMSAVWGVVGASDAGAPHRRERIWILAYAQHLQGQQRREPAMLRGWPAEAEQVGVGSSCQHPIGQLADPNVFGCLHGQAEVGPAKGGVHAQREPEPGCEDVAYAAMSGREGQGEQPIPTAQGERVGDSGIAVGRWWAVEPSVRVLAHGLAALLGRPETITNGDFLRVATGVPKRADRLKALGNGQVPAAAALAWNTLHERIQRRLMP